MWYRITTETLDGETTVHGAESVRAPAPVKRSPRPPKKFRHRRPPTETEIGQTCAVCLKEVMDGKVTPIPCGHVFHSDCVDLWLDMNHTCPTCRFDTGV